MRATARSTGPSRCWAAGRRTCWWSIPGPTLTWTTYGLSHRWHGSCRRWSWPGRPTRSVGASLAAAVLRAAGAPVPLPVPPARPPQVPQGGRCPGLSTFKWELPCVRSREPRLGCGAAPALADGRWVLTQPPFPAPPRARTRRGPAPENLGPARRSLPRAPGQVVAQTPAKYGRFGISPVPACAYPRFLDRYPVPADRYPVFTRRGRCRSRRRYR